MSDYLIEAATKEEWAERALRAEAKLQDMALDCLAAEGQAADAYQAQLAAEAKLRTAEEIGRAFEEDAGQLREKLAKAVNALQEIADPISLALGAINAEIARTILAELKQGTE